MLTVLIKHQTTGREVLHEAMSVEFEACVPLGREGAGLLINFADGSHSHWSPSERADDARDVFVMNDHGKTVARYTL